MKKPQRLFFAALLLSTTLGASTVLPVRLDAEACRKLVEAGEILSMMDLMARVEKQFGGQLLDSVLLQTDTVYIYELEVAGLDGVVRMLHINARSGELVEF
ncbi:PepSY domain-containing protein [Marinobacterium rhizophilum]|uniref:Peptidase YpeB-like protein n=1 Tax=Marinobacterium rhizophilum TaxID=420402 RepID=A0ABY5HER0_9GAMM|nr:hypothetical protein [Marinobacterium rhizophilum]UTW10454.1 hypothetical protein KDW95_14235 [Marinobacterium rhizophilum]